MLSVAHQPSTARRLNELQCAHPRDATLRNLLALLNAKLDMTARLPVAEYEARSAGWLEAACFLSTLASEERESLQVFLESLGQHLDRATGRIAPGAQA